MATFEDIKLIFQAHGNLVGLRRDMRSNAERYLDAVAAGEPVGAIALAMDSNTTEYLRRLKWASDAWADLTVRTKLQSGLAALSIPQAELTGAYTQLKNAADAERAAQQAGLTTAAQITASAEATLAAVPAISSIWPNG